MHKYNPTEYGGACIRKIMVYTPLSMQNKHFPLSYLILLL